MRFRFLFANSAVAFCLFFLLAACSARPPLQTNDPDVQAARAACRGIPEADRFACIEQQAVAALNPDVCRLLGIAVDDACLQAVYEAADDPEICDRLYLPGAVPACKDYYADPNRVPRLLTPKTEPTLALATLAPVQVEPVRAPVSTATEQTGGLLPSPSPVALELAALTGGYVQSLAQQGDHAYLGVDKRVWVLDVADPQQPRVVVASDPFPGFVLELAAAGDLLAVRDERGVHILDISDPASPAELSFVETPGYGQGMALDGARLVVSRTTEDNPTRGELRIFDLSNARQPQEVGVYVAETPLGDTMAIQGDVVYVANGDSQLSLLDISNPAAITLLGSVDLPWVQQIVAEGDYVYAADEGGLHIVDVGDLAAPRLVGRFDTQYRVPLSLAVTGRYAFFTDSATDDEVPAALGAVRVIDLADPTQPTLAASYRSTARWPYFVALDQSQAAGVLYLATGDGLEAVDVSSPMRPVRLGRAVLPLHGADVALDGHVAYLALADQGLLAVDIRDPARPEVLGRYSAAAPGKVSAMALDKRSGAPARAYAYQVVLQAWDRATGAAVGEPGLRIVDVTDPAQPAGMAFLPLEIDEDGGVYLRSDVEISGTVAFVAGYQSGLHVVDVAYPARPALLATYQTPGSVQGLFVDGSTLYLAEQPAWDSQQQVMGGGLRALDVSDPTHPREVGYAPGRDDALDVLVADGIAYVAATHGIRVLDIADWQRPTELAHYDTSGPEGRLGAIIQDMQLVDHRLYLAFDHGSIFVLDVSRPHALTLVGHSAPGFGPEGGWVEFHGLTVADGHVFIASNPGGLMVLGVVEE